MAGIRSEVRLAALFVFLGALATSALAATFTVTTTDDFGAGSLRQAILDANGNPGPDLVAFAIPAGGVQTINSFGQLEITDDVVINGYTQPGSSPNTDPVADNAVILIELVGGGGNDCFQVTGGTAQIMGLSLHGFSTAIRLAANGGSVVSGCFVGLLPDGSSAPGNFVGIWSLGTGPDTIGDGTPANRNVISGNVTGIQVESAGQTIIRGNLIGTDAAGASAFGNETGIESLSQIYVGGSAAGQGNVVSGNIFDGIRILAGSGSTVFGNLVGLDVTGFQPVGNGGVGMYVNAGGPTISSNYVSANGSHGIDIADSIGANVGANFLGLNLFGLGELGNGGAGIHGVTATGSIHNNWIAHNRYGLWIESQSPDGIPGPATTWSANRIFENGGLGIVLGNPPAITGYAAVITSVVPNAATTTINGFVGVPVGAFVATSVALEFFSSPACSKTRPQDFDEGKTPIGSTWFTISAGSPQTFSADVPVVITDEVVTATLAYSYCFPFAEGGCSVFAGSGPFSQRLPWAIDPGSGSPAGGDPLIIVGNNFEASAVVTVGGAPAGNVSVVNGGEIDLTAPALPAGVAYDVTVVNPDGSGGTIPLAWLADFLDVPNAHVFHDFVRKLVTNGVAAGVGGGNFGVDASTLRQQMAVFLLKAKHGFCYTPPPCAGVFADVPCPSPFANWIEQLAAEGITGGCGGGNYCPSSLVRRDQMAVFLLKAEHGSSYVPPSCAGTFADVPCPSPFADWVEHLAFEGITGGCGGGNYCPSNPNTRGQMAVFLTKTFQLQ